MLSGFQEGMLLQP